jgi:hypothetical protein
VTQALIQGAYVPAARILAGRCPRLPDKRRRPRKRFEFQGARLCRDRRSPGAGYLLREYFEHVAGGIEAGRLQQANGRCCWTRTAAPPPAVIAQTGAGKSYLSVSCWSDS